MGGDYGLNRQLKLRPDFFRNVINHLLPIKKTIYEFLNVKN